MTMLLTILKIIGIILLVVLLTILVLLLLVLFVPIRYEARGSRKMEDDVPVRITFRAHWLLHMINVWFRYPEAVYVRVRFLVFTLFSTEPKTVSDAEPVSEPQPEQEAKKETKEQTEKQDIRQENERTFDEREQEQKEEMPGKPDVEPAEEGEKNSQKDEEEEEKYSKIIEFFRKILQILKNIQYTIRKICDKIKHIIKNIRYYINVIQSDAFSSAWDVCSGEVLGLLRSIKPRKLQGSFTVGTGDPASTAQILAVHGMLYPLMGDNITIIPDFENFIVEGQFLVRGRITLFRFLKTAGRLYFHKDLRKVIRLLKKGGSANGRQ